MGGDNGKDGKNGADGDPGEAGPPGAQGPQGEPGADGADGLPGRNGNPGLPGPRGGKGDQGNKGTAGPVGQPGARGDRGPAGTPGADGEKGADGIKGETGFNGAEGAVGDRGDTGDRGSKGDTGFMGFKGAKGPRGSKGTRGLPGYMGPQGDIGEKGPLGPSGPMGPAGISGPVGLPGRKGPSGDPGPKGYAGKNGRQGPPGPPGPPGLAGPSMLPPWMGGGLADGESKGPVVEREEPEEPEEGDEEPPPNEVNPFYRVYQFYSSKKTTPTDNDVNVMENKFKTKVEELKTEFSRIDKPDETKDYPARTCRDIHAYHPEAKSGLFWIDPNQGCKDDAIQVTCTFSVNEDDEPTVTTCVDPAEKQSVPQRTWASKMHSRAQKWFDEDHELAKLKYNANLSQLRYLGLLSKTATQDVKVHCKKYVVWHDKMNRNFDRAMRFMGTQEQEFLYKDVNSKSSKSRFVPEVITDGCSANSNSVAHTHLRFTSRKFIRLPIVDFAPSYPESPKSEFGIELGPVCFKV